MASTSSLATTSTAPPSTFRVAAAGDIACDPGDGGFHGGAGDPSTCAEAATADLIGRLAPDAVLALGDLQYDDGAPAKYAASYAPTWGRFQSMTYPVPGNHDWGTAKLAGYFGEFGNRVGTPTTPWYSLDLGSWHLVALDADCGEVGGCGTTSPQGRWLASDLAAHPAACTIAIWHQPRFSSGYHGNDAAVDGLWKILSANGADVVLQGHDHDYERFDPLDAAGHPNASGIRSFVVGTGGAGLRPFDTIREGSVVRDDTSHGVLLLTLGAGSYSWHFESIPGQSFADAGQGVCH